ncbi:MAG: hypothetical protein QNJ64_10355 [Crocosphaera sp.]|nr:hypothetical protein [Crocosphaera sp.]
MDSPNHQPYKSRLFNFLNRQSLQWGDRLLLAAQYLRVGVEWSLQILIYPLYMMVQGIRATGKQLKLGWKKKALSPSKDTISASTPNVDRPLKRVFRETEHCLTQNKEDKGTKKSQKDNRQSSSIMVQGMASDIESKNLVLVAKDNKIIDILSEVQQQHLKKYIRLETASYWYDLKQNQRGELELINTPENKHILPPIRLFWQIMRWMQTGTLATNIDFFGESSLVTIGSKNTISQSLLSIKNTDEKLQQLKAHIRQKSNQSLNIETVDPFRLEFLIYAAIDYFVNQLFPDNKLATNSSLKTLPASTLSNQKSDHHWLSWDDLSEDFYTPEEHLSTAFLPQANQSSEHNKNRVQKRSNRRIKKTKKSTSLSKQTKNLSKSHHLTTKSNNSEYYDNNKIDINSSNWLETEAKTTGYIKHPLVRILEWLDTAIHWLEKLARKLAKLLKKRQ